MFDKERFHNKLAMLLGYERIVKDKRVTIEVNDSEEPWVMVKAQDYPETIRINASEPAYELDLKGMPAMEDEIRIIADAVHQAYIEANKSFYKYI